MDHDSALIPLPQRRVLDTSQPRIDEFLAYAGYASSFSKRIVYLL
jgi:hypothetical protein